MTRLRAGVVDFTNLKPRLLVTPCGPQGDVGWQELPGAEVGILEVSNRIRRKLAR